MKKKQYSRLLYCLGLLGMAVLFLSITPGPSWAGYELCAIYEGKPYDPAQDIDGPDTDKDGFSDWLECYSFLEPGSVTYMDQTAIEGLDPEVPDAFVVVKEQENSIRPPDLLMYGSQLGITFREINEPDKVDDYRQVCPLSYQKAVPLFLSSDMGNFIECPAPDSLIVGSGNVGTPMDYNATAVVFTRRIEKKIQCLYQEAGYDASNYPTEMNENILKYIRHTAIHEVSHNFHLRYLCPTCSRTDSREWDKYGDHYSEKDVVVMSTKVVGSIGRTGVELPIGIDFVLPVDPQQAQDHMTGPPM